MLFFLFLFKLNQYNHRQIYFFSKKYSSIPPLENLFLRIILNSNSQFRQEIKELKPLNKLILNKRLLQGF
jgi:hypothetical protein